MLELGDQENTWFLNHNHSDIELAYLSIPDSINSSPRQSN